MSSSAEPRAAQAAQYDGSSASELARALGVPRLALFDSVGSTLDVAHSLGSDGAPAGSLVIADQQTAGRGRQGRTWHSAPGQGIWLTLLERPRDTSALDVLSIRIGLAAAAALDRFTDATVGLKWPNDLQVADRKLAGILIEARWRDDRLDHVAIGFGLNVTPPPAIAAGALRPGTARPDVLAALVPALRHAAAQRGALTSVELQQFAQRDVLAGRTIREPAAGIVAGIARDGALVVRTASGDAHVRAGSIVLAEDA